MDPVAVVGYPRKWLRFLFVGDIWTKGANTPKHFVYDIKKDSVNHAIGKERRPTIIGDLTPA